MAVVIKTNNQPRRILGWGELTPREQQLLSPTYVREDYIRYRGITYPLSTFQITPDYLQKWDMINTTHLSYGVVLKFHPTGPRVIMGHYFTKELP